jgi:ABC-type branched-subunit amino acid transport system substrate-binding protein
VAQQLGRILAQQRKGATILGSNRLYAPGTFRIPGSYISESGPDITALPADASIVDHVRRTLPVFGIAGPPAYAATHVIDEAIASVCQSGRTPSRSDVLTAVRATDDPTSILGIPIRFRADGNLTTPRWFLFRIDSAGRYRMVPES